jgi:hypothetical protein
MKRLLPIILCFVFQTEIKAQHSSNTYLKSVRQFFRDWSAEDNFFDTTYIFDDAVFLHSKLDSAIMHDFVANHYDKKPWKVYKSDNKNGKEVLTDSIAINKNEVSAIWYKMKKPAIQKWFSQTIPATHFLSGLKIDSLYNDCCVLHKNGLRKIEADNKNNKYSQYAIEDNPLYKEYDKSMNQNSLFYSKGYWKICPPVFFGNDKYCILYYARVKGCPRLFVQYNLSVYKRIHEHWEYFGLVTGDYIHANLMSNYQFGH